MMIVASNSVTISNVNDGTITHIAYADSADGKDGFYVGGGTNLLSNSRGKFQPNRSSTDNYSFYLNSTVYMTKGQQYTVHADASSGLVWSGTHDNSVVSNNVVLWLTDITTVSRIISDANTGTSTTFTWNDPSGTYYLRVNTYKPDNSGYAENVMLEKGTVAHPWSPAPSEAHPTYMGTYTDYTEADSTDYKKYTWTRILGSKGESLNTIKVTSAAWHSSVVVPSPGVWISGEEVAGPGANGAPLYNNWGRGHNLVVLNKDTFKVESVKNYDDYTTPSLADTLATDINALKDKIVIVLSIDSSTTSANLRSALVACGGNPNLGTWSKVRYAHAFIGMSKDASGKSVLQPRQGYEVADSSASAVRTIYASQGGDGLAVNGQNGNTTYFHQAWADSKDGKVGFSLTDSVGKKFLGTYSDFTPAASANPAMYSWIDLANNVQVGGRNYLLNTAASWEKDYNNTTTGNLIDFTWEYSGGQLKNNGFVPGDYAVLSYDWEVSNMKAYAPTGMYFESSPFTIESATGTDAPTSKNVIPSVTKTKGHVVEIIKWKDSVTTNIQTRIKVFAGAGFVGHVKFSNAKVEVGNRPTDWTPAPEDVQVQITNINGELSQTVSKTELNNKLVGYATETWTQGQIKTTADNINLSVQKVQSNIDNMAIGSTNYLLNSDFAAGLVSPWNGSGTWSVTNETLNGAKVVSATLNSSTTGSSAKSLSQSSSNIPVTTSGLISFYAKASVAGKVLHVEPWGGVATNKDISLTTSWVRYIVPSTIQTGRNQIFWWPVTAGATYYIACPQFEIGTKVTDWHLSQADFASEIEHANLEIKVNGIQGAVASKADQSQVTQLANQITSVVGGLNSPNLVREDAWYAGNGGTLEVRTHPFYIGTHTLYILKNTKSTEVYAYAPGTFKVKPNTKYTLKFIGFAGSNVVDMDVWVLCKSTDGTKAHNIEPVAGRKLSPAKAEIITATFTTGANDNVATLRFDNNGSSDAPAYSGLFFAEVQIVEGENAGVYQIAESQVQSQITQMKDDINLKVAKNDVVNQINVSSEGILIDGKKVHITGNTKIDNASISVASIKDLTADAIKAGTLSGDRISGGTITGSTISAGTINGGTIKGSTITGATVSGGELVSPFIHTSAGGMSRYWSGRTTISDGIIDTTASGEIYSGGSYLDSGEVNQTTTSPTGLNNIYVQDSTGELSQANMKNWVLSDSAKADATITYDGNGRNNIKYKGGSGYEFFNGIVYGTPGSNFTYTFTITQPALKGLGTETSGIIISWNTSPVTTGTTGGHNSVNVGLGAATKKEVKISGTFPVDANYVYLVLNFGHIADGIEYNFTVEPPYQMNVNAGSTVILGTGFISMNSVSTTGMVDSGVLLAEDLSKFNAVGTTIWNGAVWPNASQTIYPSTPLNDCLNGWVLLWSKYNASTSALDESRFYFQYIPKWFDLMYNGRGVTFIVDAPNNSTTNGGNQATKYIYITNNSIKGHGANTVGNANNYALREVHAW